MLSPDPELQEEVTDDDLDEIDVTIQFQMMQGVWIDSNNNKWSISNWEATSIRHSDGFVQRFEFEETDNRLYLNHARVEHVGGDIVLWSFSPIFLQGSTWVRPPVKNSCPIDVTKKQITIPDDISSTSSDSTSDWVIL